MDTAPECQYAQTFFSEVTGTCFESVDVMELGAKLCRDGELEIFHFEVK
jgi:hypothetical protein